MTDTNPQDDLRVARARELIAASVDDELFGLETEQGHFYGFNAPATRIWELIEQPTTLSALCTALVAEFAVEPEECRTGTLAVLRELETDGMVTLTRFAA